MWSVFNRFVCGSTVVFDPTPVKTLIGANFIMYQCAAFERSFHINHSRLFIDISLNGFCCITRLLCCFGYHRCIGIPDMAHFSMSQNRPLGFLHRFAIPAIDEPSCRISPYIHKIIPCENSQYTRHVFSSACVNGFYNPICHFTAGENRVGFTSKRDVVCILT